MRENRGPWYLLTGLVVGVILGLGYAWLVEPVEYINANPASLRADFKDHYRLAIAAAFAANADLARAQVRLNLLEDPDPSRALSVQAQQALADGRPEKDVQALSLLAVSISQGVVAFTPISPASSAPTPFPVFTPLPEASATPAFETELSPIPEIVSTNEQAGSPALTPSPTSQPALLARTPNPTPLPRPSVTPSPTPGTPYVLETKKEVCDPLFSVPLLMVEARDAAGQPVPGVEVIVTWPSGEDHFFTGLKPDLGWGYADFSMTPGISYTVYLAGGGEPVPSLAAKECQARSGAQALTSWQLIFVQP